MGNKCLVLLALAISLMACKKDKPKPEVLEEVAVVEKPKEVLEFGFNSIFQMKLVKNNFLEYLFKSLIVNELQRYRTL